MSLGGKEFIFSYIMNNDYGGIQPYGKILVFNPGDVRAIVKFASPLITTGGGQLQQIRQVDPGSSVQVITDDSLLLSGTNIENKGSNLNNTLHMIIGGHVS